MTISKNEVFIGLAGPNLDLLCVRQLDAVPFCEIYAKFNFDAKRLEKRMNRGG